MTYNERECEFTFAKNWWSNNGPRKLNPDRMYLKAFLYLLRAIIFLGGDKLK